MAILSSIERRAVKYKVLVGAIYAILIAGAATMAYPFMLMISGSMKSDVDIRTMDPLPAYLFSDEVLYKKFLESKYNKSWHILKTCLQSSIMGWEEDIPWRSELPGNEQVVADYREFLENTEFPSHWFFLGHSSTFSFTLANARRFRAYVREAYDDDLARFNRENVLNYDVWNILSPNEWWHVRRFEIRDVPLSRYFTEFKYTRPRSEWAPVNVDGIFQETFLRRVYTDDIERYNQEHNSNRKSFAEIPLTAVAPSGRLERRDWVRFVCPELNVVFIRARPGILPYFQEFLRTRKYQDNVDILNQSYGTTFSDFSQIPLPDPETVHGAITADWKFFLEKAPSDEEMIEALAANIAVDAPSTAYREFVKERFGGDLAKLNAAYGSSYGSFDDVMMPVKEYGFSVFEQCKTKFRRDCMARNFLRVFDYVLLHGRGLLNTTIYCVLAIATALLVNPLAAYALSRFGLPSTYKVLLFLLATMAFPVEVTMIPSFLLLRNLNLLNTFFALVLPGAANGYSIFLLKGFFDSLPKELYESATIDGAGEWTMFWRITMAMSKPILAVIALGAFTSAFSSFMFALVICPDRKMWTLMVYLYQLQVDSHQAVVYASLVIGAIPTFLVFLFCQNIIMRGIVVPTEK